MLALGTVAVANLVLTAVPFAVTIGRDEDFSRWAAVVIRFVGTLLLASAALVDRRTVVDTHRARLLIWAYSDSWSPSARPG